MIFGDVFLLIPNIAQFSFAREKNSQPNRQIHKQTTFETRLSSEIGYNYKERADIVRRCANIYPQQFAMFICAEK